MSVKLNSETSVICQNYNQIGMLTHQYLGK